VLQEKFEERHIVKLCVLATSSSGNCTFVGTSRTRLLVDAGLSRKETLLRLAAIGEDPTALNAILITHEHTDHVSGLVPLARQLKIPVYLTHLTAPAIPWNGFEPVLERFQAGTRFTIGDIEVQSFTIPHDAADPVGYWLRSAGVKVAVAMDLGYIPDSVKYHLQGTHCMVLESNHDVEMLKVGPYPWAVKQRVMGRRGHLSNDIVSEFIRNDLDHSLNTLLLGHLSQHNNHPEIVRLVARQAIQRRALDIKLEVAEPGRQSAVYCF